jgi:basic membrane lipoprotein Med (substrate-binding protein (PBP1-ABC) superfamily)
MVQAISGLHCASSRVITSVHAADYAQNLELAAREHDALVIAPSFLLADAVGVVARANPGTRFMLVDPLLAPSPVPNLISIQFRRDQSAFLAGALAGLLTRTGIVAGIYGPGDLTDREQRIGYEHGAEYVRPGVRVLAADQPADDGAPYDNPAWGGSQARAFAAQGADVIFGAGGRSGRGALEGAAATGRLCIGDDLATPSGSPVPSCLVGNMTTDVVRGVDLGVRAALTGTASGTLWYGLDDSAVGLEASAAGSDPGVESRLRDVAGRLRDGSLNTGA